MEVSMRSFPVIKNHNIFKDFCFSFFSSFKFMFVEPFLLQFTPKGLHWSIIPAVTFLDILQIYPYSFSFS